MTTVPIAPNSEARMPLVPALETLRRARRDDEVVITTMGSAREWMKFGAPHALDIILVPSSMGQRSRCVFLAQLIVTVIPIVAIQTIAACPSLSLERQTVHCGFCRCVFGQRLARTEF